MIISSIPTISIPVKAEASVDGKLITVGGKTVTKNMKIDDVKKMFGIEVSVNWRHNPSENVSRKSSGGDDD